MSRLTSRLPMIGGMAAHLQLDNGNGVKCFIDAREGWFGAQGVEEPKLFRLGTRERAFPA